MLRTYLKILVVILLISTNIHSQTPCTEELATLSRLETYPYFSSRNIIISHIERDMFDLRQSKTLNTGGLILNELFTIPLNPTIINFTQDQLNYF